MGMKSSQNREDLLRDLEKSVFDYDAEKAVLLARQLVDQKIDLVSAIDCSDPCHHSHRESIWLRRIISSGSRGSRAGSLTKPWPFWKRESEGRVNKRDTRECVVIGTVLGDIHSIGKNMVCCFLQGRWFQSDRYGRECER